MLGYLRAALAACRLARVQPSFLLHPLDLLSGDEVPQLSFFPGMGLPARRSSEAFAEVLRLLCAEEFEVRDHGRACRAALLAGRLPEHAPGPATRPLAAHGPARADAPYASEDRSCTSYRRALVIGAAGNIGAPLVGASAPTGYEVLEVDIRAGMAARLPDGGHHAIRSISCPPSTGARTWCSCWPRASAG